MNVLNYLCFLAGNRDAIHQFAASYWTLAIGGLFVLSAGISRNYTRHDLRSDTWRLAIPFAAAIASSFGLWAWLHMFAWWNRVVVVGFVEGYASFLGPYLLTAPLAWIYGVQVERWTYRTRAVRIRLAMLGLVATWRVALILRVLYVLLDASGVGLFFVAMMYVSVIALVAIIVTSRRLDNAEAAPQVIEMMGAMPAPERREQTIIGKAGCFVSVASLLCLALSWFVLSVSPNNDFASWQLTGLTNAHNHSPSIDLWIFSAVAVGGWLSLLPKSQRQLALADRVQRIYDEGQFAESLAIILEAGPKALPPNWKPPPNRFASEGGRVRLLETMEEVLNDEDASWLVPYYRYQLTDFCSDARWFWKTSELQQLVHILSQLRIPQEIACVAWEALEELTAYHEVVGTMQHHVADVMEGEQDIGEDFLDPQPEMTSERIAALNVLRQLAGVEESDDTTEEE